jgi:hypothetical protein
VLLAFDPFKWFSGLPEAASARQLIRVGCFMIALWLSFVWFLLVRPLQTGIAVDFRKYDKSTAVLRSDQPARFWGIFRYSVLLLTAMLMLCLWILVGGLRELRKSHTPPNTYQARAVNRKKIWVAESSYLPLSVLKTGTPTWFTVCSSV